MKAVVRSAAKNAKVKAINERDNKAEHLIKKGRERGYITYSEILKEFPHVAATTIGFSAAVAVLGWYRESAERRSFAQRERMRVLNAELARVNTELAHLNAEKNEFMAIAAHASWRPPHARRSMRPPSHGRCASIRAACAISGTP